jgi:hypothetical protein
MRIKDLLLTFVIGFAVTFVINAGLVYGWNYFVHGTGIFNWPLSFAFAVMLGIVCTTLEFGRGWKKKAVVADK